MKNEFLKLLLGTFFLFGVSFVFIQCEDEAVLNEVLLENNLEVRGSNTPTPADICECIDQKFPTEALSDVEKEALVFMMEEEKLARDVYLKMGKTYDLRIFSNITVAETRHMESVRCLINKYGLENPVKEDNEGVFVNQDLQNLYDSLVIRGAIDLTEALRVGATIEDVDIYDLVTLMENEAVDNEDVIAVFESLTKGSRNHLRAFVRNLDRNEASYEAQYISEDMYTTIIEGEQERGNGICSEWINCPNEGNKGKCNNSCVGTNNGKKGPGGQNCIGTAQGTNCQNGNSNCKATRIGNQGNGSQGNCNGTGIGNQGNGNGNGGQGNGNQGNGNGGNGNGGNGNGGN